LGSPEVGVLVQVPPRHDEVLLDEADRPGPELQPVLGSPVLAVPGGSLLGEAQNPLLFEDLADGLLEVVLAEDDEPLEGGLTLG
ncbi:MAG: hypothetical protein V3R48_04080, partial [Thermoplasmata archaeon]